MEGSYCSTETFNARCAPGYVVHITQATYGRMKQDRCIEELSGVACYVDLTSVVRNRCAERRTCKFGVTDQFLLSWDSCPPGLVSQLYAGYRCIPGLQLTFCRLTESHVRPNQPPPRVLHSTTSSVKATKDEAVC